MAKPSLTFSRWKFSITATSSPNSSSMSRICESDNKNEMGEWRLRFAHVLFCLSSHHQKEQDGENSGEDQEYHEA